MPRYNLQIKVGTYTGDGVDNRSITDVGFRPQLLIVKGDDKVVYIRTKEMGADETSILSQGSSNSTDRIQGFLSNGFQVGANSNINGSGVVFTYIAIRASASQRYFSTGVFMGNGADDRDIDDPGYGTDFIPDFVQLMGANTAAKIWTSSASTLIGRNSRWDATATGTNTLQDLIDGGFQVGSGSTANASGILFYFWAMKNIPGIFKVGKYVGDGTDSRNITGLDFDPDIVFIKRDGATAGVFRTSEQVGDSTLIMAGSAPAADMIQSLITDGFQVGANIAVNNTGDNYHWIAFKSGDYSIPIERSAV